MGHGKARPRAGRMVAGGALPLALMLAFGASAWALDAASAPASQAIDRKWIEKQRGKAGLYLRLAEGERERKLEFFLSHPLVDALWATFKWADLEPKPGQFDFAQIDRALELCRKHGKGMVLGLSTYGQKPANQPTPEWLYDQGVKKITFSGGGVAKGREITVPRAWDDAYVVAYGRLIQALGARYNGQPGIWNIRPGFGHIGNLNAQPSETGGPVFLAEGWTPEIWKAFCLHVTSLYQEAFPDTPLVALSAAQLLKNKDRGNYLKEANEILEELAHRRVSVISFGLEPEIGPLLERGIISRVAALSPYALRGEIRLGIGDDWPLWVPANRRKPEGFLRGRDEAGLTRELNYAFGGVEGLPKTNISILFVLHPEMEASHPELGAEQNKKLFDILAAARDRLKEEDPIARLAP